MGDPEKGQTFMYQGPPSGSETSNMKNKKGEK